MRTGLLILFLLVGTCLSCDAQLVASASDTARMRHVDTTIVFKDVNYCTFKNAADQMEFYKDLQRIRTVLPYVRMAKHLYAEAEEKKLEESKHQFKHYRKDTEKEMRATFEKDVKDLYIAEGKVLFKLLSRETNTTSYKIIKDMKGGFSAWTYQIVAKHYTYDLKEQYDPRKDWILEMAIKYLGTEYNPN